MRLDRLVKVILGHLAQRLAGGGRLRGDCCALGGGRGCRATREAGAPSLAAVSNRGDWVLAPRSCGIATGAIQPKAALRRTQQPSPVEPGFLASSSRALRPRLNSAMRASSASRDARTARERGVRAKPGRAAARQSCLQRAAQKRFIQCPHNTHTRGECLKAHLGAGAKMAVFILAERQRQAPCKSEIVQGHSSGSHSAITALASATLP